MKIKFFTTITTLLIIFSLFITPAMAEKKQIQWHPYDTGIKLIKEQNKKGFLHFYTDWCTYCKVMNRETFVDSKIVDYLNDNFISIRVNAEKQKDIAKNTG